MNELIKKLKEEATSYTWNGDGVTEELDEEKFAELLIKDCAAYVNSQCMQPSRFTAADLLERYGIKDE